MGYIRNITLGLILMLSLISKGQYTPCIYNKSLDSVLKLEKYVRKQSFKDSSKTVRYYQVWWFSKKTDTIYGIDLDLFNKVTVEWLLNTGKIEGIRNANVKFPTRQGVTKKKWKGMNL